MNTIYQHILNPEVQAYILANYQKNIASLALQKTPFPAIDKHILMDQLLGKKKAAEKLPTWFQNNHIIYPRSISIEQASSEISAAYKAQLMKGLHTVLDASGGFGVDAYYFASCAQQVIHCEQDADLSAIVRINNQALHIPNMVCKLGDSTAIISNLQNTIDCIYIDPARRNEQQKKVFQFEDCTPNVIELLPLYFEKANNVIIKSAPLVDIQLGIQQFKYVKAIHIVAIDNEVKELLWILQKGFEHTATIHAVNIQKGKVQTQLDTSLDALEANYSMPLQYLYEPNSALLKAGWFKKITHFWPVYKLNSSSHLYTSSAIIHDFHGRIFVIEEILPYQKAFYKSIDGTAASISIRNFPLSVADLRKKHSLKESSLIYYFFTTDINNQKIIIKTKKI
jgi:16S rRNA G966 N2-methylase RsmD